MLERERYAQSLTPLLGRATAYARSILRHRQNADDAVQQAAIRGLERIDTYDPNRSFKAWWFTILRNCCIDMLRLARATHMAVLDHDPADQASSNDDHDWLHLAAAMEALSMDHREILRLKYFADQSYDEIAQILDIPKGTVMSRLHLARKALALRMNQEKP
jgi:RNA polymerase sigma-70 factor (ECF subfamily)